MIYTSNRTGSKDRHRVRGKASKGTVRELIRLLAPYRKSFVFVCILIILVNLADIAKPYILKIVIDDYMTKASSDTLPVLLLSLGYLLLALAGAFISYAQVNRMNGIGQGIVYSLREKVFYTIHRLPLGYFNTHSSGGLVTRATSDISEIGSWYTDVIADLFKDILLLAGILTAMFLLEPRLAALSLAVVPVIYIVIFTLKRKIKESFYAMKHYIGKINGFFAENISGIKIIQCFGAEGERLGMFRKLNGQYYDSTLMQVNLRSILKPASDLLQDLSIALLLWQGMGMIFDHTVEIGVLYAMITYTRRIFRPISDLAEMYDSIQSSLVSAERVFDLTGRSGELEETDSGIEKEIEGSIEFQNVWFAYKEGDWILKDVSFKIDKGQKAALIGETGAGKTTIINLICGFYSAQKGRIFIDGIDIEELKPAILRKSIALVLQDVFLFSGSLRDNITLKDDISEERIDEAVSVSGTCVLVDSLPDGIDTFVNERGSNFSAGQRQFITLARAVAHNPSIYILDEATANVDTRTEKLIQKAVKNVTKNHTSLIIAHRLSTIRDADLIIVIDKGRITEMGSEKELFEKDGYYKKILQR